MSKRKNDELEEENIQKKVKLEDEEQTSVSETSTTTVVDGEEKKEETADVKMSEEKQQTSNNSENAEVKEEKEEKKKEGRQGRSKSPVRRKPKAENDDESKKRTSKSPSRKSKSPKRSKSPIRGLHKKSKPSDSSSLKRAGTMDSTMEEAKGFLGDSDLLKSKGTVPETRARTKARHLLTEFVADDTDDSYTGEVTSSGKTIEEIEKEETQKLKTLFYIFDTKREGVIREAELAEILRTMGKRPFKNKIRELVTKIDKSGEITLDAFIAYFLDKRMRHVRLHHKNIKKETSKSPSRRSKSPKKKGGKRSPSPKSSPSKKSTSSSPKSAKKKSPTPRSKSPKVKGGSKVVKKEKPQSSSSSPKSSSSGSNATSISSFSSSSPIKFTSFPVAPASPKAIPKPLVVHSQPVSHYYRSGMIGAAATELAQDGVFGDFNVVVLIAAGSEDVLKPIFDEIHTAKGFQFSFVSTVDELLQRIDNDENAVAVQGESNNNDAKSARTIDEIILFIDKLEEREDLKDSLFKFYKSGRGIGIFTNPDAEHPDNHPLNYIIEELFQFSITGSHSGSKDVVGNVVGYESVYTGVTEIPVGPTFSAIEYNGSASADSGVTVNGDRAFIAKNFSPSFPPRGRVVIDAGACRFTAYPGDKNLARLMSNVVAYLTGVDKRILSFFPLHGTFDLPNITYVWQYFHNGWYDYFVEGGKIVEDAYQNYVLNPGKCDVRSVKSGHWEYMVDFLNFTQTNVQHYAHTQRNIRRVPDFLGTPQ